MFIGYSSDTGPEQTAALQGKQTLIGRGPACDIVLADDAVSWNHAAVWMEGSTAYVEDLGSTNGTFVGSRKLTPHSPDALAIGASFTVGSYHFEVKAQRYIDIPSQLRPDAAGQTLLIGRGNECGLRVDHPQASWHHAEATKIGANRWRLTDLGSSNGTFVNGQPIQSAVVGPNDQVLIGGCKVSLEGAGGGNQQDRVSSSQVVVTAESVGLTVQNGQQNLKILDSISLQTRPGELLAVLGKSGCGKTTLVQILAGLLPPTTGKVLLNNTDLHGAGAPCRGLIGFVPQGNVIPKELPLGLALLYCAKLRFPNDSSLAEAKQAVEESLSRMDLSHCRQRIVGQLSGGELKRANIAAELLCSPSLLILDEPSTGLDAGMHLKLMSELKRLAASGRTLIVVTHTLEGLSDFDRVILMVQGGANRGGRVAFCGTPADTLDFFQVKDFSKVYDELEPQRGHATRFFDRAKAFPSRASSLDSKVTPLHGPGWSKTVWTLVERCSASLAADKRSLFFQLAQTPILAFLFWVPFGPNIVESPQRITSSGSLPVQDLPILLFLVAFSTCCTGLFSGAREIVKERSLMNRERQLGVSPTAYLASKGIFLFGLAAIQAALMVCIINVRTPIFADPASLTLGFLLVLLGTWTSSWIGLLISAYSRRPEQAVTMATGALSLLVLFSGLIHLERLSVLAFFSNINPLRWTYGGLADLAEVPEKFRQWGLARAVHQVMETTLGTALVALVLVGICIQALTWLIIAGGKSSGIRD